MDNAKEIYSEKKVVSHFYHYSQLQPPEKTILELLEAKLGAMKMLDIAAGAGRTTRFFAPLVKDYTAMDFSGEMHRVCKNRFEGLSNARFQLGDMRTDLDHFKNAEMDFLLCSFNGIDHLTPDERVKVLTQARRICKSGGYFAFSSHNIQCLQDYVKIKLRLNLYKLAKTLLKHRRFIELNKNALKAAHTADYITLFDNLHDFGFNLLYVRPEYQIKLLHQLGFEQVKLFDLKNGKALKTPEEISKNTDYWLYYLCS